MKKILTVSLFAMMAVSAANADIASTKYVTDRTGTVSFTAEGATKGKTNLTEAIAAVDAQVQGLSNDLTVDIASQIGELNTDITTINNSAPMNSGITKAKVDTYDGYSALITAAKKAGDDAQATANSAVTVNTQQATAISGNTAAINTLKGDKTVTGSVAKSIDDAFTEANLSQYATTSTMNTELGKKQNNLSQTQMAAVNSGITTDKVTKYDGYDAKITAAKKAGDDAQATANSAVTVNTQQATAISGNTAAINTLKGDKTVTGSVAKSIDDAFTEANLSQYATTSTMNTELGKKQNNLSQTQMAAVNSGITTDKVTKYDDYDAKISQNKSAITANTTSINTINNSAVMNSGVTDKVVKSVETHTTDINTIKASDVMKSGVTADVVAKANSAMQETNLKALESWTTGQCAEPTVTCSLISKGGKIAWEVVTY